MTPPNNRPIIFVIGVPRSGTTLLRLMLAGNPRLFSPPEMVLAPFETMADRHKALEKRYWEKGGLERTFMELEGLDVPAAKERVGGYIDRTIPEVYAILQDLASDRILVDKCPHLSGAAEALPRLHQWFPNARFLWITRHPAAVIQSLRNVNMAEALAATYGEPEFVYRTGNASIRDFLASLPAARSIRFQYEEMVRDPEAVMRRICASLAIDFHPAMLEPYEGERMRSGPKGARAVGDPNTALRHRIEPELADSYFATFDHRRLHPDTKMIAHELGYDLDALPLPPIANVSDAVTSLLETARNLEKSMDAGTEIDSLEGRRFLLRVLSAGIETLTEYSDADHPRWHNFIGSTRKLFGDCPDCDYKRAPLRMGPGRVYRLSGRISPNVTYIGFVLQGRGGRLGSRLNQNGLSIDTEGRFEVLISTDEQPGVWMRCDGDETEIVVRQYFNDRRAEKAAKLEITLLGDRPAAQPLQAATYAQGLAKAERMLTLVVSRVSDARRLVLQLPSKRFHSMSGEGLFPTPDNLYQVCWYRFGPGQAFVVRGRLPKARYFGFCLYNAWMESLDYDNHAVCVNGQQLQTDADGQFTMVLSDVDPGVPNWLDTAGHRGGYLLARSVLLDGEAAEFSVETVWLEDLASKTPGNLGPSVRS